jgi:hypothetical protein
MKVRDALVRLQTLALNNPETLNEELEVSMFGVDTTFYVTDIDTVDEASDSEDVQVASLVLYVK